MEDSPVVLIGPVLPYRGGIAQHTTMLHRALQQARDVITISFARQYPAWLFPGESDRDPAYEGYNEPGVTYLIDSLNPLTWRQAVRIVLQSDARKVIIPWWTFFWAPCFGHIARRLRHEGREVIFFCHNVVEHETAGWKQWLTERTLRLGSRFVVHTREDAANLKRLLPQAVVAIQPHPIYDQFPAAQGALPRRRELEVLFYGFVRPYKGLDTLLEAMRLLKGKDIQLTIAGEFWEGEKEAYEQVKRFGLEDQVEIRPRYHSDEETAELFERADVVVLPYKSATGSGVVPMAYHYEKPVIVTHVGGLPDVVREGKTGFLVPPENPQALARAMEKLDEDACRAMRPAIKELKRSLTWERLAEVLLDGQQ